MSESIIVALTAFAGGDIDGELFLAQKRGIDTYRLEQLEKKVDKHNSVIERTYQLEKRADVVDEKIKVANHRIEDLEKEVAKK